MRRLNTALVVLLLLTSWQLTPAQSGPYVGKSTLGTATIGTLDKPMNALSYLGADIGAKINAAITAAGAKGARIKVPPGAYSFSTTIRCPVTANKPVIIEGDGMTGDASSDPTPTEGTILSYTGNGDAINQVITSTSDQNFAGCHLRDLTVDGTGAGSSAIGFHFGGTNYTKTSNVSIRGFRGAGIKIENTNGMFTERYDISDMTQLTSNTIGIDFVCDGGCNTSFAHSDIDVWLKTGQGQVGLEWENNSGPYD